MKKLALLSLSMLILANTVQPALAVNGLSKDQFKSAGELARMRGIKAGAFSGFVWGLGNSFMLSGLRNGPINADAGKAIAAFNVVAPAMVGGVLVEPADMLFRQDTYVFGVKPSKKVAPTEEQRAQLRNTARNYQLGTEILVKTGIVSALASGAMSTLLGKTHQTESNSVKNFCTVLPFALTLATVFTLGTYKLLNFGGTQCGKKL